MKEVNVSSPLCAFDIYTDKAVYSTKFNENSPSNDLVSVATNKTIKDPAGDFTAIFKGHKWYNRLRPNDLVVIQMGRPPEKLGTVMVGLIDEVRRTRSIGQAGGVVKTTTVRGRDFGKVFLKAVIKWFPQLADSEFPINEFAGADAFLKMVNFFTKDTFQQGTPTNLIKNVIEGLLNIIMDFEVSYNGFHVTLKDILRYKLVDTHMLFNFMTHMSDYEGPLWNYIEAMQNKPFYELIIDARTDLNEAFGPTLVAEDNKKGTLFGEDGANVVMYFRETPFDQEAWDTLPTWTIESDEIIGDDIGRADHENYNVFLVTPLDNILGEQVYRDNVKPLFNGNNLKKFGINYLEPRIEGLPAETEPDLITLGSNMTAKTKKWYENNINYENGSMQIKGKNLKVGQRLYDKDSGVTYYIEGVSQSFTMFSKWITTLTLTRGQGTTGEYYIAPETSVTPAETTQTPEPTYYIVDSGDTLWSIAVKFYNDGAQYLKIVQANPQITGDTIYKGQKLLIPDPTRGQ